MSNYRITKEDILHKSNGGLDIILRYYPDAQDSVSNPKKKFKIRDESTPSAAIKKADDGNWIVADFGDDGKWRNGIGVCQKEEGLDFGGAIMHLASIYGMEGSKDIFEPEIRMVDASPEQPEGERYIDDVFDVIPEHCLMSLFSEKVVAAIEHDHSHISDEKSRKERVLENLRESCTALHFFALKSYTIIKNRKAITITATDYYPIFLIHEEGFQKIYQPKAKDKGHRFMYVGKVDPNFLHGFSQAQKKYNDLNSGNASSEELDENGNPKVLKLQDIFYCTGGSDALNIHALGYNPVWPSSEYFKLQPAKVKTFLNLAENVYTCPDLDATGQLQNHRLCMDDRDEVFLDIKTVTLPEELKLRKDYRGNACKDVRDYLRFYTRKSFRQLVSAALPYRFWDSQVSMEREGKIKIRFGRPVYEHRPNPVRIYNFLQKNGFFRYVMDKNTRLEAYVHIVDNVVRMVEAKDIRNYINAFLERRFFSEDIRNAFHKSALLSDGSFQALKDVSIDFQDFDRESQLFFFENAVWRISRSEILAVKPGNTKNYVWEEEVIKHKVKRLEEPYAVTRDESGIFDIEIKDNSCLFFKYLINTSRIYWREELEKRLVNLSNEDREAYKTLNRFSINGAKLSDAEISEQKQHLINKIYSLGYLLHRYKDPSKPWAIFAMDNKLSEDGLSHGGSGKSIAYKAVRHFMKSVTFDGRNNKLFDNDHVFERVNQHTDYMLFDDANRSFQFDRMFSLVTGELIVNPKGTTQYELQFSDVPKTAITSNFTPNELSPTVLRRLLFTVFGDYYHHENNGEYNETRTVRDDFGKNLFDDFTPEEWNLFFNFMATCLKTYLNFDKIEPPMKNVNIRALQNLMGMPFLTWADVYFDEQANTRDAFIITKIAMDDFMSQTGIKGWSTQAFNARLEYYCKYKGLVYNPAEVKNKDGRIVKSLPVHHFDTREKRYVLPGGYKTTSCFYVRTPGQDIRDIVIQPWDALQGPEPRTNDTFLNF